MDALVSGEGRWEGELNHVARDGRHLRIESRQVLLRSEQGHLLSVLEINRDITDRNRAQEEVRKALAEAEEGRRLLDALMESVPLGITIADAPNVNIRRVSRFGQELIEKPSEEITGIPADEHPAKWDIYHSDGVTRATADELPLTRATRHGEIVRGEEWVVCRKDGSKVHILCTAAPIRDKEGRILAGVIGWQDVTDLKRAEQALRQSERRYSALFANKINGIAHCKVVADADGNPIDYEIIEVNDAYETIEN